LTSPARLPRDEWLLPTLEGLVTPEQLAELRLLTGESVWEGAVRRGWTTDDLVLTALASRFRMKIANLSAISPQALQEVTEQLARRYRIMPLQVTDASVDIATSDPHDLDCERTLAFALGRTVRMHLAAPSAIAQKLDELYRPENVIEKILDGFGGVDDIESISEEAAKNEFELSIDKAADQPIIRLVDRIIAKAIQVRASDIHLEPEESGVMVRYRIDGVLRDDAVVPRALSVPLVARVKIMAQLDIADRLRPQDGRARVAVGGARIDLRISTLPASLGEKVVIRILDSRATVLSLDGLGLAAEEAERIQTLLNMREGILLVTGPTGSGKTTTLYSALRQIQKRGVNIVTVEDPVEYRLQGIVQVQVNEKTGLTFAAALRSILRQDPDVILVGEIRDRETAQIATQASLTGHLVLSTLHTIDAASSVTRLADIGIESYKVAAALKGIIAQRLLRRLCPSCKALAMDPVPDRLQRFFPPGSPLYRAVGCPECSGTGYRGRFAIMEIMITTPEVERRIAAGEAADRITEAAREGGMRTMWDTALGHVRNGLTTLDELLRVVEAPGDPGERRPSQAIAVPVAPADDPPRRPSGYHTAPPDGAPYLPPVPPVAPEPHRRAGTLHGAPPNAFDASQFDLVDVGGGAAAGGASRKVLLVEDEDALRRVMKDLLEREGFVVHEAGDGVAALDEVDRWGPDVVVLDLNLPRLDGYGVLSHLRARPQTATLPVIVLTAKGDEDSEVRVFEFGASDYLTKPFRPRALSARLHSLLNRPQG
jgi:type II secretory ATPase GspE/PulE/Tfp pilus assembly ATPase PilB-like protein